jgi:hypothetical protein
MTKADCGLHVVITFRDGSELPLTCRSLDVQFSLGHIIIRFCPEPDDSIVYPAELIKAIQVTPTD